MMVYSRTTTIPQPKALQLVRTSSNSAHMDTIEPHLPPLPEDPSLARLLPAHLDHREFRRVPHAPDRYVASLLGAGVWDLHRACFLIPQTDKDGRRRFRLNPGPNAKPRWFYYSVILALIVLGPPPHPEAQAHHKGGDPTDDRWDSIFWQSPQQNRAVAAEHQARKRRMGETNGQATLSAERLARFIRDHDEDRRKYRPIDWWFYAFGSGVSQRQLRRIAKGESRKEEVEKIRQEIARENNTAKQAI